MYHHHRHRQSEHHRHVQLRRRAVLPERLEPHAHRHGHGRRHVLLDCRPEHQRHDGGYHGCFLDAGHLHRDLRRGRQLPLHGHGHGDHQPRADGLVLLPQLGQLRRIGIAEHTRRHHLDACDRCVEDADTVLTLKALVRRCCRHTTAPDDLRVRLTARYSRVSITRVDYVEFRPPAPPA